MEEEKEVAPMAVSFDQAMKYVELVRASYLAQYPELYRVLNDHTNHRIGTDETASRVRALFPDSPDIAAVFMSASLPESYKIRVDKEEVYVQIKVDNPAKYDEFHAILKDYTNNRIDTDETASRVKALFRDKPDLRAGLSSFLTEWYKNEVKRG